MLSAPRVVVVGAGMGGLAAALELAAGGADVTLLERHGSPGGKMREIRVGGSGIDSGPTVFTMRRIFEELFAAAGLDFRERVDLRAADVLARHAWLDGTRLDLYADLERSVAAIDAFAGPHEADAYRRFAKHSRRVFDTLDGPFMRANRPGPLGLALSLGLRGLPDLLAINAFRSLWGELGRWFGDPRLRQLFGRYATYCGSSPFAAPATLMLIAHAERAGVWTVAGGMQRLAEALAEAADEAGAALRYGRHVSRIVTKNGRASGVELADGEVISADAIVFNGDAAALASGLLGEEARRAVPARVTPPGSLSALTLSMRAAIDGFPLAYHTVFFGEDYPDEFASIFDRGGMTAAPTVYVCAQDRAAGRERASGPERLFCLVNAAPAPMQVATLDACRERLFTMLRRHGLEVEPEQESPPVTTSPAEFDRLFPGTGGALYGRPTHGWRSSFLRPAARSRIPGLYLAGGSVHPGPGVPMAALSGRLAAARLREDFGAGR